MNPWTRTVAAVITGLSLLGIPLIAGADTQEDANRLRSSRKTERYEVSVHGASIKAGGGRVFVNAPIATVRRVVTDYAHYEDFMPRFKRSRVVGRTAKTTDVYLQVPILNGSATVWSLTRFQAPRRLADGTEVIEGTMLEGNVKDFRATWYLTPIDDQHTLLRAELLIVPTLPLPGSLVTGELAYAADKAVTASRDRAEAAVVRVAGSAPTTP